MRSMKPVLLVEDDDVDAMAIERAISDLKITRKLVRVNNGEEALVYLKESSNPRPCIIFLDLNMPKMNGIEFLKIAKADLAMKRIPVVVLTTSKEQRDVLESFDFGVGGYVIKPVDYKKFVDVISAIDHYWSLSELPCGG